MLAGGILQLDVSKIPNKSEELSAAIRVTVNNGAEVELEQQTGVSLQGGMRGETGRVAAGMATPFFCLATCRS